MTRTVTLTPADLLDVFVPRCVAAGMSEEDARRVVAHYVASDVLGRHAHGIFWLPAILDELYKGGASISTSGPGRLTVNAAGRPGVAAIVDACDEATAMLASSSSLSIGISDYVGPTGSLGWFAYMLADRGIGSISVCNSIPAVAVPGTGTRFGGTNPIAFGIPGDPPFIADYASSVMSTGGTRMTGLSGDQVPDGVMVTGDGVSTKLLDELDGGAMAGFGGHKGHVQSVAIEVLCGLLAGSKVGRENDRSTGTVMFLFETSDAQRPDAVAATRASLLGAVSDARMPGEALSQVPTEFLWNGESDSDWAQTTQVEIPDHVSAFLSDRGFELPR